MPHPVQPTSQAPKRGRFGAIALATGLTTLLSACLPSLEIPIPQPSGTFPVGITQQILRTEASRDLTLDIWYPASSTTGHPRAPYTENALNDTLSQVYGIPRFLYQEVPSFSHQDAPPAPGPHPTVIFNHGFASFTKQNASNFQELASHGYVVISLAHPGESLAARDAQGRPIPFDMKSEIYLELQKLQKAMGPYAAQLAPVLERQRQARTPSEYALASAALGQDPQYAALKPQLRRWETDTRNVIQALQTPGRDGVLTQIDPFNLTVMGHSLGGAVAMHLASRPVEGLRGIINLDGPWFQDEPQPLEPIRVPALNLVSTQGPDKKHDLSLHGTLHGRYLESSAGAHLIEIKGAAHYNFTDLNYVTALRFTPMLGPVDNKRMAALQNQAILEFLRRTAREGGEAFEAKLVPEHDMLIPHVFPPIREVS